MNVNTLNKFTFNTLYGKDKSNKTKEWKIMVREKEDKSAYITFWYGYINSKKVECNVDIYNGKNIGKKNETTPFTQAYLEAQSRWKRKKNEGYKESLDELEQSPPPSPMLAHEYKKHYKKISFPCYIQPKLDGYRMLFDPDTKKLTSRTGKEFTSLYETELYKELVSSNLKFILDGELYIHSSSFNFEKFGILRKQKITKEEDILLINKIEYHIYDVILAQPFEKRNEFLNNFMTQKFNKLKLVDTYICNSYEDIEKYHSLFLEKKYEGSMIRTNGIYIEKFRSYDLLKKKDFDDQEFVIKDFAYEIQDNKKLIIWTCDSGSGNKTFNIRPKGTFDEREYLYYNAQQFIGCKIWIKFFGFTEDGLPRFPTTYRDSYKEYIRDQIF